MFIVSIAVAAAVVYFITRISDPAVPEGSAVAATIYPLYDIVRSVAGDAVQVQLVVPPGASPHLYEFTPRQLAALQNVELVFAIGHGLDDWTQAVTNTLKDAKVVTVDEGIALHESEEAHEEEDEEEHQGEEEHGPINPHYWLHFGNAWLIVGTIRDALIAHDPANAEVYRVNAATYRATLIQKEEELIAILSALPQRNIITLHDAWPYFAENFDLMIAGTFEPAAGDEPTPRYLARLRQAVQAHDVSVLFVEPQLSQSSIRAFADDLGLRIAVLDPLGGEEGRMTFVELMEYNVKSVAEALSAARL